MKPIRAKTILIRRKQLDSWFISRGGMNLYRGCEHDCLYCDGRAETYRVEGDFCRDAVYKENAVDILTRELDPRRRRKPFRPGYLFIGGGVSDSWQPAEKRLRITRAVLELLKVFPYPLLVLTKSDLILRDLELLVELNRENRVTVAVSLSTVDGELARFVEPGASSPARRLEVLHRAREAGLGTGVMYLPIIPMLSDSPEQIDAVYAAARDAGARFVCPGPMTLKPGRQKDHYLRRIAGDYPGAAEAIDVAYGTVPDRWGNPSNPYFEYLAPLLHDISQRYGIPRRIPSDLFPDNLNLAERSAVILDQMDGLMRERRLTSSWGRAARSLANLEAPLESPEGWKKLRQMGGVGSATERIIKEILDTGTSRIYQRILVGGNPSG